MALQLAANALCSLADLKSELGITDSSRDDVLTRRINAASQVIEAYCNRKFVLTAVTELISAPLTWTPRLRASRIPIRTEASVVVTIGALPGPGTVLTSGSDFVIENAATGTLYSDARWYPTALRQPGIVQDWDANTEKQSIQLVYIGGYVTQPQLDNAGVWPGITKAVKQATLIKPAGFTNECWMCTTAGTSGGGEPSWGASPSQGDTKTDGSAVWTYLGTVDGTLGIPAKSIPFDLEFAALQTAKQMSFTQGVDTTIKSESMLSYSVTYGERSAIPPDARNMLDQEYVQVAVG